MPVRHQIMKKRRSCAITVVGQGKGSRMGSADWFLAGEEVEEASENAVPF